MIEVAILSTEGFDARTVVPLSVRFGPGQIHVEKGKTHLKDVDKDGDIDVVLHFRIAETGIHCGATTATLTAMTISGQRISGADSIKTVGS